MQQPPPGGRPGPPYQPSGGPPRGGAPQGGRPPGAGPGQPQYGQQPYGAPQYGSAPPPPGYTVPPPAVAAPVRKKRGALRMVAGSCVFSAWLTLVVAIVFTVVSFLAGVSAAANAAKAAAASSYMSAPTPTPTPGAGLDDLGIGGSSGSPFGNSPLGNPMAGPGAALSMVSGMIAPICFASAAFNLVSGIVGFILFLGLAQACYALIDLEEQSYNMALTLQTIVARLGSMR